MIIYFYQSFARIHIKTALFDYVYSLLEFTYIVMNLTQLSRKHREVSHHKSSVVLHERGFFSTLLRSKNGLFTHVPSLGVYMSQQPAIIMIPLNSNSLLEQNTQMFFIRCKLNGALRKHFTCINRIKFVRHMTGKIGNPSWLSLLRLLVHNDN